MRLRTDAFHHCRTTARATERGSHPIRRVRETVEHQRGALRLRGKHAQVSRLLRRVIVVAGETDAIDQHGHEVGHEGYVCRAGARRVDTGNGTQSEIAARAIVHREEATIARRRRHWWITFVERDLCRGPWQVFR